MSGTERGTKRRLAIDAASIEVIRGEDPRFLALLRTVIGARGNDLEAAFGSVRQDLVVLLLLEVDRVQEPTAVRRSSVHLTHRALVEASTHQGHKALVDLDLAARTCARALLVHLAVGQLGRSISLGLTWELASA